MNQKPIAIKQAFIKWKLQGKPQNEFAAKYGVSEKTVSRWNAEFPQMKALKTLRILQDRLQKEAKTLTPDEVVKMADSIAKLHKVATAKHLAY